jgi:hypothetical protein
MQKNKFKVFLFNINLKIHSSRDISWNLCVALKGNSFSARPSAFAAPANHCLYLFMSFATDVLWFSSPQHKTTQNTTYIHIYFTLMLNTENSFQLNNWIFYLHVLLTKNSRTNREFFSFVWRAWSIHIYIPSIQCCCHCKIIKCVFRNNAIQK